MRDEDMPSIVVQAVAPDAAAVEYHFVDPDYARWEARWSDIPYDAIAIAARRQRRLEERPNARLASARAVLVDGDLSRAAARRVNEDGDW